MKPCCPITNIFAREILDSRGFPTIEVTVEGARHAIGRAAVPSGASTGSHEAHEKRDGGNRYHGKGVLCAVEEVNTTIRKAMLGENLFNQNAIDNALLCLDGSENKQNLGANAILGVSLAASRAAAASLQIPLYTYLGGKSARMLPTPMMNIFNGGQHASNNVDIQEFMIMPVGAKTFAEGVRWCSESYHSLKKILSEKKLSVSVGDEGGFASDIGEGAERTVLELLCDALSASGLRPGKDAFIALDAAAADWKQEDGSYLMPKSGQRFSAEELCAWWAKLRSEYPIISIEDPLGEDDFPAWTALTSSIGKNTQLVGDDLFTTNKTRLSKGIQEGAGNAILIKPNQIGSLTETLAAIFTAKGAGFEYIISHRSGETEDAFIADLSVATNAHQIKTGAPCRSERTVKYNRLMRIELELGACARYAGGAAFTR